MKNKIFSITVDGYNKVYYILGIKITVKYKHKNTPRKIAKYVDYITKSNIAESKDFVSITTEPYKQKEGDAKLIAFYLPQFHSIPLNDENFGKGFTEWTNVTKAIPQFTGHNQPQLPIDVGFYDLSHDDVMYRQIELAKMYGIYGFCFHYYWFSGKRLLEKPIFNWLNNKELDFPFCLCWANENWSKLWDGGDKEVVQPQELRDDDPEKFFNDILPFIKDERYIKINNKPLLIIYYPQLFGKEKVINFAKKMRENAKAQGFDDMFLVTANSHDFKDNPADWGLDAMVEFPPHQFDGDRKFITEYVNPEFAGHVMDMAKFINEKKYAKKAEYKLFKTVFPSWDNSPRKAYSGGFVLAGETPELYKKWLKDCIDYTKVHNDKDEQFVFINAWNEWAEGAHLEPDQKYGYAYLQATKEALEGDN